MDVKALVAAARRLSADTDALIPRLDLEKGQRAFNVHAYAMDAYEAFLRKYYTRGTPTVGAVAMNPGRNGAVQTGIPFADLGWARQILPAFDDKLGRVPAEVPSGSREFSGRRVHAWGVSRFGSPSGLYGKIVFFITCPLAVLTRDPVRNVPIPALKARDRASVLDVIVRHAPALVEASGVPGIMLLGRYAESVWAAVGTRAPRGLRVAPTLHPAAHMAKAALEASWDRAFEEASGGRSP